MIEERTLFLLTLFCWFIIYVEAAEAKADTILLKQK